MTGCGNHEQRAVPFMPTVSSLMPDWHMQQAESMRARRYKLQAEGRALLAYWNL